jgi:hypothetical protein
MNSTITRFAPELVKILSFVESGELSASLLSKYSGSSGGLEAKKHIEIHDSKTLFQVNLLKIRKSFEMAIRALKLDSNYVIFIDGIDIRPGDITYADYFDCVRGLIEAIWSVNNDFLANVKDSGEDSRCAFSKAGYLSEDRFEQSQYEDT